MEQRSVFDFGHRYRVLGSSISESHNTGSVWTAKAGSHDDGELSGLFLGGIGGPVVGRDLDGTFSRWHLQNGYHLRQSIDCTFLGVRWQNGTGDWGYFRCTEKGFFASFPRGVREVETLFPLVRETYTAEKLPFRLILELYTPLVGQSGGDSIAPIERVTWPGFIMKAQVQNLGSSQLSVDMVLFWPNLLGWTTQKSAPLDRPSRSWPGHTHEGNTASPLADGVLQKRNPDRLVTREMEGEVCILSFGGSDGSEVGLRTSVQACLKAGTTKIDRPPRDQGHTYAWAEAHFARTGVLPPAAPTWTARWDEALASALHRGVDLEPQQQTDLGFVLAFDLPLVSFGGGRSWYRKYTERWGETGRKAQTLARWGLESHSLWREEIDQWHRSLLFAPGPWNPEIRGTLINELYYVNAGGTTWVSRWAREHNPGFPEPLLGGGQHGGILEGYDTGYFYYNTSDLWPYAWYALARWWPTFADLVFRDLMTTVDVEIPTQRVFYRTEEMGVMLAPDKVAHDIGSPMGDPWHRINGYQMRDDSNLWKDHNSGFILSTYLYFQRGNKAPNPQEWAILKKAGTFLLNQDQRQVGLPYHDEFGDSTWDNLEIRGYSTYSGVMNLGALAALESWAKRLGDQTFATETRRRIDRGIQFLFDELWIQDRGYFRLCSEGKYRDSLMADSLLGFYFADLAGLDLGTRFSEIRDWSEAARKHMAQVYEYNFLQYEGGQWGPLLVSAPGVTWYSGDGGDELQVNEVLVGSAWLTAALLAHWGLEQEAERVAGALGTRLHGKDKDGWGLQFRTPAAYDHQYRFRAPMNLRPLGAWFLTFSPSELFM